MRFTTAVPLAKGGTSEVFKAWDPVLKRPVALKFLLWDDPIWVERLMREARAQAKVEHPNICQIFEIGEQDGAPFIAMQFIDGQELGEIAGTLSLRQRVQLMATVAEAVHMAHRQGLIHRDLKPSNIMVEADDKGNLTPYVLDFGLVRDSAAPALTVSGQTLGTPSFMAPEQVASSDSGPIDRRTDIWGLGATLYTILLGQPPYSGKTSAEVFVKILSQAPPEPRRLDPTLPRDLSLILKTCLSTERERRYGSALALGEDLQRWLDNEPIHARPPSWTYRLSRRVQRHRAAFAVALLALVSLLILGGWGLRQRWEASAREAAAQRFGSEVQSMEWMMRVGHLLPAHDIRQERARVRAQLDALQREVAKIKGARRGPAHYALGRGLLELGELDAAWSHLETSWDLGFRSPEAAYARGLVMGGMFRREATRARALTRGEERERRLQEIHRVWRDPAIAALQQSRESSSVSVSYVEAQIAFHEERWEDALESADSSLTELPWLFEAHTLAGDTWLQLSVRQFRAGEHEQAAASKEAAQQRFTAAIEMAPSWPRARSGLCGLMATNMHRALNTSRSAEVEDLHQEAMGVCETALEVDPDSWNIQMQTSDVYRFWGMSQYRSGQNAHPTLQQAVDMAQRAAAKAPDEYRPQLSLADAYLERGSALESAGPASITTLRKAVSTYRRVQELHPRSAAALNNMGIALRAIARYERSQDKDPTATLDTAIESYRSLAEVLPSYSLVYFNIALARQDQTDWLLEQNQTFHRAAHQKTLQRNAQTVTAAREATTRLPDHATSHGVLALALATGVHLEAQLATGTDMASARETFLETGQDVLLAAKRCSQLAESEDRNYESISTAMLRLAEAHRLLWPEGNPPSPTEVDPLSLENLLDTGRRWCQRFHHLDPDESSPQEICQSFELPRHQADA